jgi:hypothetical protein
MLSHGYSVRYWQKVEAGKPITLRTRFVFAAYFQRQCVMLFGGWTETPRGVRGGRGSRARESADFRLSVITTPSCDRKISISHPVLAGAYCKVEVERWSFYLLVRMYWARSWNVCEFVPDGLRNFLFQSPREPFLQFGGLVRRAKLQSKPLLSRPANRRFKRKPKFIARQSKLQLHVVARS